MDVGGPEVGDLAYEDIGRINNLSAFARYRYEVHLVVQSHFDVASLTEGQDDQSLSDRSWSSIAAGRKLGVYPDTVELSNDVGDELRIMSVRVALAEEPSRHHLRLD